MAMNKYRRLWLVMAVAFLAAGCSARQADSPTTQRTEVATPAVVRVGYTVRNLKGGVAFFRDVLDFEPLAPVQVPKGEPTETMPARVARLELGAEQIELTEYSTPGRPIPEDSASNDLWFEHLAIVVSDMDRAYERLVEHGVSPVSMGGPQTIPMSNPAAGGIRAFYFEDPEHHVLELIWYPADKGSARWHESGRLFLGIDHTAIAVSSTDRSLAFYEGMLGFVKAGESLNHGREQAALSGVDGARVRITGLAGKRGMGVELLEYLEPGPGRPIPPDTRPEDAWHWEIAIAGPNPTSASNLLRDPDRHVLRVVGAGSEP